MSNELQKLQREVRLYKQMFEQYRNIDKKYNEALDNLKEIKATLELKVEQRTQEIKEKQRFLQSIIDGMNEPVIVINKDYTINMMNRVVKEHIYKEHIHDKNNPKCYEVLQYRGLPCDEGEGFHIDCPLRKIKTTKAAAKTLYTKVIHQNAPKDFEALSSPLFDEYGEVSAIIQTHRDITEHLKIRNDLEKQKDEFDHQAHYDTLTELPNRLFFNERLFQSIQKSQRSHNRIALLFIDLDRFKQVNDTLGHDYGDRVLQESAKRIQNILRVDDTLFRLGGDEFTVIMENITAGEDASKLAKRIIHSLEEPMNIFSSIIYISGSIGISIYPDDSTDGSDLIRFADAAMYQAKDEGRNNFKFFSSELTQKVSENFDMELQLRKAIRDKEFQVYYQPQIDANTKKLTGMEALVRWIHPEQGIIYPDKFIPLAEDTGLIVEIDDLVMQTAMQQFKTWYDQGLNPGVLALNISVKKLEDENFIPSLKENIEKFCFNEEWLEIELTESDIMRKPQENIKKFNLVRKLGIKISIDDFGTGYSSLSYLKKFPISKLKIDQSFIKNLPDDEEDAQITKVIVALSKSLNLQTIAEGVETQDQEDFLLKNTCNNIQGFLYSKPISAEDMNFYLSEKSKK